MLARQGKRLGQLARGHQQAQPGVLRHESQPLPRKRRIQGHVGRSGFEDPQHRRQCLCAALHTHPHPLATTHAACAQRPSQTVGTRLQFPIRERARLSHQRRALGPASRLGFKQRLRQCLVRIIMRRIVPIKQ